MQLPAPPLTRKVYSTASLNPDQQFAYWRESICEAFAALDPVAQDCARQPFLSLVEVDPFPGATLSLVQSQAQRVVRAAPQIRRDPSDCVFVNLMLEGSSLIEQAGVRSRVGAGDMYVVDASRPYVLEHPEPFRLLCLNLPRERIAARGLPAPAFALAHSVREGRGLLALGLLRQLRLEGSRLQAHEGADAFTIACSWLAAVLADPAAPPMASPQPHTDLWRRALRVMEQRLAEPELSPATIAVELRVSLRYLHLAFARQDATVASTLRSLRLQRCAEHLRRDPGRRTIAAIAQDCGFMDMPNFQRLFRRHFGHTPGEHRAGAHV